MMVLYHLHNPNAPAWASTCNKCGQEIETGTGFRCTVCPDFDMCHNCKMAGHVHEHPMVVSRFLLCFFGVFAGGGRAWGGGAARGKGTLTAVQTPEHRPIPPPPPTPPTRRTPTWGALTRRARA
jgi:hypothetical protein